MSFNMYLPDNTQKANAYPQTENIQIEATISVEIQAAAHNQKSDMSRHQNISKLSQLHSEMGSNALHDE